ncbi:putative sulfate transporter [Paraburkholderia graminis C4D1M]|uniref:Sulphate transporter n=1 Tax=Paraburkholderia graminis (strain ATCC 700544 / DSM 17151 / LMG 18924 / NCIMB 13744 / C4D1M) TaxID=396598 RepID=B1G484_PARG4|nr:SulP family inorganic anion transporter [Paraburkholderia graminis]EDT09097.1 sulphate transporter [Paraburkholderia graminis C4D1M]CAB3734365.1 putative sulfate transporter [Paraburkholderia graminis C4D1M]
MRHLPLSQHGPGFHLPVLEWVRGYDKSWVKPDCVAGVTAAAVVLPKAMAYATVSGLPVQIGLYTALVPMVVYALLGTSRPLSVSTTATLAILTATALGQAVPDGGVGNLAIATATLTLLVGVILVLAGLLRLGFVANFISEPVLTGFKGGIAVVIVLDQLPKLFGIHVVKGSFVHNLYAFVTGLPHASAATIAVGAATVAILVLLERLYPKSPAPLIAVACGIAGVYFLGLPRYGIEVVGHIPTGLPSLVMPDVSLLAALWPAAVGIALMSFTESIAAGRAFVQSGEPVPLPNRELVATGLANAAGALLGSMPAGGGTSQTAVNRLVGARSQLAELVTAAVTLGTMLLLAPLIGLMPYATLAGVVIVYSVGLFKPADFRAILAVRRTEFVWALVALAGVVLLGTLRGILIAILVSLVALAYQVSNPPVHVLRRKRGTNVFRPVSAEHPDDEEFPGMLLVRPEGRIFFLNASNVGHKITPLVDEARPRVVALDMRAVFDLEYTALKMLTEAEKKYREAGIALWLVGLSPGVFAVVQNAPLGKALGRERMFLNLEQAVTAWHESQREQPARDASLEMPP